MSGGLRLGGARVERMGLEIFRQFDGSDYPYVIEVNGLPWALTVAEARRLAQAAKIIPRRPSEHMKPGPRFRARAAGEDGHLIAIELGVEPDGDGDCCCARDPARPADVSAA
jgi:hypothetical protein